MSKSRSTSLEQGELSPDFNDSPHIDLEMISESELRREKERKRKREEQEQMDEHEDVLTIKPPQVKLDEHEHIKKVRRSDDRNEERSKKRSHHESDRLERLERERRRLDNERHRHLDKIQKEREYEREVTRREKSGRVEEDRRRDERRDHRSRPARDTHTVDHRRSRKEPRERPESSPSPYSRKDERRRDHGRRERIERERRVEEKVKESDDDDEEEDESEDETSQKIESQESEVVDDEKVSEDDTKGQEVVEEVNGGTPKYDHLHFARSKFDIEEDDDDDSTQDNNSSNNNNNNKSPTPINHNQDKSPSEEIDEDEKKSDDEDDDADSVQDINDSKIIEVEDKEDEPELPSYFPAIQGCRSVEEFHCLNKINEGTYGVVYRAVDLKLREVVALKRLKLEKEKDGFPITSLREIKLLMMAKHPNIVAIKEVVVGSNLDKVYMVMEYVEHDLKSLMESMKDPFTIGEVKTLMLQLLRGVEHLHDNWIIHRDLKTSNLLLSHSGVLKIADFGLAREYGSPLKPYTPIVVTLWYRSPELLLQTKKYSIAVDMWSVGCIFAEFLLRRPLFAGKTEIDQLGRIFKVLGSPNEDIWPGVKDLPVMQASTFTHHPYNQLRKKFEPCLLSEKGFQLMNNMLTYCPEKRMTADMALGHDYFSETPLPTHTSMFPTWPAKSELYKGMKSPKAPTGGKAISKLNSDNDLTKTSNMPSQGFFFKFC